MRKIFTAPDPIRVHVVRDLLEDNGIPAVVQVREEIPFHDAWASVMISDTADYAKALKIVQEFESTGPQSPGEWTCPVCGEIIGTQFKACWKCAPKTEVDKPTTATTQRNTNLLLRIAASFFCFGILFFILDVVLNNETFAKVAINMAVGGAVIFVWGLVTCFRNRG